MSTGIRSIRGLATITQPGIGNTTGIPLGGGVQMTFQFTNNAGGTGNPGFDIVNGPVAPNDYILYDPATADRFGKNLSRWDYSGAI